MCAASSTKFFACARTRHRRRGNSHLGTSAPAAGVAVTTRYVHARVRREVYARDDVTPYAKNGAATADDMALYCAAHNATAADRDFGHAFMVRRSGREFRPSEA